jgi:hypothetical protein
VLLSFFVLFVRVLLSFFVSAYTPVTYLHTHVCECVYKQ